MAYTYNIPVTVRGGRRAVWDGYWDGSGAYAEQVVGIIGGAWYQSSMMFDNTPVAGKTITGITLNLTVASGTIPSDGTQNYPICDKADSSTTSWKRSSTSAVNGKYIRNQTVGGGTITANNTLLSIDMGTTLPTYGYVAGPRASSLSSSFKHVKLASTATLAVTTNETYREYTLAYNANGGSGAPSSTSAWNIQVNPSCTFTVSSTIPTRTGYTFLGWSTSSTATSAGYGGGSYITVTTAGTTTLYAVWMLQTYTVAYNKGSYGTGTNSTATKTYNVTLALNGAQFTRTGYTQTGWATYDGGAQAYALYASYTANASVTLYPTWTPNTYQISYNANGGTGAPGAQTKTYGATLTLSYAKPTRASELAGSYTVSYDGNGASNPDVSTASRTTSYAFSNWNTAANGYGTSYASGGSYTENAAATLYAQWTPITTTASVTLPTPTRTGYRFDGWFTAQTGGTQVTSPYTPGGNVTLYAHWTATASIVSAPNGTIGSSLAITITRGSTNSYTHDLSYSFGSLSNQSIATVVGTSYSWSIPSTLALQYPNTDSALCTITCVTKNGSTVIGTTTTTITLSIPYKPTISIFTASPVSANSAVSGWGIYLKGYSRVKLDVVAAAGYGASIINVAFSGPGISQTNSTSMTAQSPILSYANATLDYTVTVKDSRQQETTVKLSDVSSCPYFLDYAPPVVTGIAVGRCDSSGNPNNSSGSFLSAKPSFTFSSIGGRNSISSSVLSYGLHGSGSAIASKSPVASGETYDPPDTSWAVAAVNAYDVTLTIADAVLAADGQTIPYMTTLPSVQGIWFGKGNDRLGLGGVPNGPGLQVDWDATFNGVVDVVPRRSYAWLSSPGWYRVMKLTGSNIYEAEGAGGFIVDFNIVRNVDTANNEAHKISLMATWSNIKFVNEQSVSNTLGITKIRTTYSGSNLFVDVYYGLSTGNTVTVAFNVTCRGGDESKFISQPFTSVAPSPEGETVLAEYTFTTITGARVVHAQSSTSFGDAIAKIKDIINDNEIPWAGQAADIIHANISNFSNGVVTIYSGSGPVFFATLGKYSTDYYAAELFTYNYPWRIRIRNSNGTYHAELYYPNY